ncbi:helix-turn-helix domain-containing protein [Olsenella sp. YH-ols2217]|uniref:Helix-turn-helix domain-containing protein n=1 Tax=Kribbibacterium absianum TaxID=3044210 RepID=A0ABT6ZJJ5_9ACTN|nr:MULTISPECIES: TetR/AcrR family transcriptional regulator [unclassified Olsenella]MDJ1121208.1 helix-turn-helix domain-containing protein [Olsenella sp. YH-ols2216]MDJ1128698.1 helix-turn-helix domain-containing protein [Olsenella sp. YH-ols2217]
MADARTQHAREDADARCAQIVSAARALYEERGLSSVSVGDITAAVGVTRSLFYHYFPNQGAVTSAVLDAYVSEYVEKLAAWNARRRPGDIEHALTTVVGLLRQEMFEDNPFHEAIVSTENASLYLQLIQRVADHTATYLIDTTVQDYASLHPVAIDHLYETFYLLIVGLIGLLRAHPDLDDGVVADLIAQTLHMDRNSEREDNHAV